MYRPTVGTWMPYFRKTPWHALTAPQRHGSWPCGYHLRSKFRFVAKYPDPGATSRAQCEPTQNYTVYWKERPSDQSSSRLPETLLGRNANPSYRVETLSDSQSVLSKW